MQITMMCPTKGKTCFNCGHLNVVKGQEKKRLECRLGIIPDVPITQSRKKKGSPGFLVPKSCKVWTQLTKTDQGL